MARDQKPPGWRQGAVGELEAEFLGTAIIILFGTGSVAMSYWAAQVLGAFAGAAVIYLNYHSALHSLDGAQNIVRGTKASSATVSIFVTTPGDYGKVNFFMWVPIARALIGGALGAFVYDLGIRDSLLARGVTPDPEIADEGRTAVDEPGGAAQ